MGKIKRVIVNQVIPVPEHNTRLVVELCENVHVHYRNLRLEFSAAEFAVFQKLIGSIDPWAVKNFRYGANEFWEIGAARLPAATEFNDRLQIEEQVEGHFHIHYRNLRIEVNDLAEIFGK
jgi:hypothetical protein